jgi:hypothetical protein
MFVLFHFKRMGPRDLTDLTSPAVILDVVELELKLEPLPDLVINNNHAIDVTDLNVMELQGTEKQDVPPKDEEEDVSSIHSMPVTSTASTISFYESHRQILSQVILPFFIAGFGSVGAGIYLSMMQVK